MKESNIFVRVVGDSGEGISRSSSITGLTELERCTGLVDLDLVGTSEGLFRLVELVCEAL